MTITIEPLPPMSTVLGAIDAAGRRAANRSRSVGVAAVRRFVPARTGRARAGVGGSVRRTINGYVIEVRPTERGKYASGITSKQVLRWLETGTGEYGPKGRPIRPRRGHAFHLPGGWVSGTIRGQRAQRPFGRALQSSELARVQPLVRGAWDAAQAIERLF